MKTSIKFQHVFLLFSFFALVACQPKMEDETSANTPKAPTMTTHAATFMGNVKAIKQHIAAGSDLNVKDDYGSTPLNIAVTFEKTEIAKLLIDAGADLSIQSADGSTALHTASFLGRTELVEALLKAGADTEAQNSFGSTPLASIEVPFEQAKPIYDQLSKDLGPLGFKLDYDELENARPVIAEMIKTYQ